MRAKIVLVDGMVVEAEGTPVEIAELTAALGRSHQTADRDQTHEVPRTRSDLLPGCDSDPVEKLIGPDPERSLDHWIEGTTTEGEAPEFDEELDVEITDLPAESEATPALSIDPTHSAGPPLELVVREVASQFKLMADQTRLQILTLLADREHNVGELCEALGGMSQPAVSHHLALLRVSGLVSPSREGKFYYYDLTAQGRTLTGSVARFGTPDGAITSALFRQASDTTRLQILLMLSEAERNVGELCEALGGMSQPSVSHHLALMRHGGLVEARRDGKFSYYSLQEVGLELTCLVVPMMGAKAGVESLPGEEESAGEAFDFSSIPDDWTDETPTDLEDVGVDETAASHAPPAHRLCRRVLLMVRELHRRGYERLRVAPGLTPTDMHWRCSIVPSSEVRPDHGAMTLIGYGVACYSTGHGSNFFGWADADHDSPMTLADKFLGRFSEVAAEGHQADPDYASWYARMLRATDPDGLIYAYADWDLPADHLPVLGCTADVKIPLPPPVRTPPAR
jgi:DNA-binding transcriptional ArsR family regulator